MGKQYIILKRWRRISGFSITLLIGLTLLFVFALKAGVWISSTILGTLLGLVIIKILADLSGATHSLEHTFKILPEGIPEKENKDSEKKDTESIPEKSLVNQKT